jgi:hypothetical protein
VLVRPRLIDGQNSAHSEKFYKKGTTPEEIQKIEFQDRIEKFAEIFELENRFDIYDYIGIKDPREIRI